MTEPELVVADNADQLADDVAHRLLAALGRAQQRGRAALALTAGSIMEKVWAALADTGGNGLDWSQLDVYWADERFVPADSADRNDLPAHRLLFGRAPFSAARQFSMPASDGPTPDLDQAAAAYASQLRVGRRPGETGPVPNFDVVLLGLGPDGHCASLFPEHPGVYDDSAPVIPVRNSPKPPPERLSFTFSTLAAAEEIWFVAAGAGKADAVAAAHSGAPREQVPSAGPKGRRRTLWLIDRDAAAKLP
ncbi:MAG TPA: 6-phosphogluconolactonase [Jatrophihabitans sp.]|nr:6-phosphogluconolactonase [Jatrophihabitans sp.]